MAWATMQVVRVGASVERPVSGREGRTSAAVSLGEWVPPGRWPPDRLLYYAMLCCAMLCYALLYYSSAGAGRSTGRSAGRAVPAADGRRPPGARDVGGPPVILAALLEPFAEVHEMSARKRLTTVSKTGVCVHVCNVHCTRMCMYREICIHAICMRYLCTASMYVCVANRC